MHIGEILAARAPTFSLEFFPPKTSLGWDRLFETIRRFEALGPDFVSVTYGAGGSTRAQTHELVRRIITETKVQPVPHLTCVCHATREINEILQQYADLGVGGVMALGGDAPRDTLEDCDRELAHAIDLVKLISAFNASGRHPDPRGFAVGVAGFPEGHPATPNRVTELDYLKQKIDAGADYICTQLFFDNRDFLDFRDRCRMAGITVPILAGLMPVVTRANFERIPSLALGSRYPAGLLKLIASAASDEDIRRIGIDWATQQSQELVSEGVDGIHFYTLNRFGPVRDIWSAIRR